jgi:hypothetical protein
MEFDEVIDSPMYQKPALPLPREILVFPGKTKDLWLKALERPETDLRYKAAEAIALAHRAGVQGLKSTIAPLLAALDRSDQDATVRLAVAEALVALEAREAAPNLLVHAQAGRVELRNIIEPALARWDYQPVRALWLERLREPKTSGRSLVLAIRGAAAVHDDHAVEPLRQLLSAEGISVTVFIETAQALGALRKTGLEKDAERLSADTSPRAVASRFAAVALLRRHASDHSVAILQRLARDPAPAVAAAAVARLLDIDPVLVTPLVERLMADADAKLRMLGVEAIFRRPGLKGIRLLGDQLGDPHRDVRSRARRSLRELAKKAEFREGVIAEGTRMLASTAWQPQEQATILLAQLAHKPAAGRFVELLASDRAEVYVTAAWGLRKLAVPETLPQAMRHADAQRERLLGKDRARDHLAMAAYIIEHQLSQINQFLGEQRFAGADAMLRRFIPKPDMTQPRLSEARAAAIWALGLVHAGKPTPGLSDELEGRLTDAGKPPEDERVRAMSAISLGRIKALDKLATLRRICPDQQANNSRLHNACGWAIEQLTGAPLKAPEPLPRRIRWFLMPNE